MAKIITDEKTIDELLERGVEKIYPNKEALKKRLLSGRRMRLYCGFDPSAASLHIGNAIQINKLAQFQSLGHEVIFLIGDFTGMIGDPTDKTATRKKLTRREVLKNCRNYKKQASAYLKFGLLGAKVKYNSRWLDRISFRDLIELASNFTVQQMIIREMFQERLKNEKPIHLHEFLYPLAQGYDSVVLDVDLEVGGNDQMFNMMAGRDLMKALRGREKFVLTTKLLVDPSGKKMGKSEGNIINLDAAPKDMYGQVMSWPDGIIIPAFELCTNLPLEEIKRMEKELSVGANPRDFKMKLAGEITKINHGEKKAREAEDYFIKTVQKKEVPDEMGIVVYGSSSTTAATALFDLGFVKSKSEAKRLAKERAIKVFDKLVDDVDKKIDIPEEGIVIQKGKRCFGKISKK